jgi:peptidoglycan/xylan/chitin deacetylase (PgdA/CDA1 family)
MVKIETFYIYIVFFGVIIFSLKPKPCYAQILEYDNSNFFYQISPIYDFKKGIVSITFDDGYLVQFKVALPILKEMNIPATFYLITSRIDTITKGLLFDSDVKKYELGSHTITHPDLVKLDVNEKNYEISGSKIALQKYFGYNSGLTMSYPWGSYDNSVKEVVSHTYIAARSTNPGYNLLSNLDRYELKMQNFDRKISSQTANYWVDYSIQKNAWLIEMVHGINKDGYSPIDSSEFMRHLDYINDHTNEIWCSTVSNVIKYLDESKNAIINCESCNDAIYNIRVDDMLPDSIYNQELSIKVKIPNNWESIQVEGIESFKIEYSDDNKFVLFNTLPDNRLITIKPYYISERVEETGFRIIYTSENPFKDRIRISIDVLNEQNLEIIFSTLEGRPIIHKIEKNAKGVINLDFNTAELKNGFYIVYIKSLNYCSSLIKKLVKN